MFWGLFLLTLGSLFLLTKYDVIQSSFDFVWNIWPLIFVFWGAVVIFRHTLVKPLISGAFGIFLAVMCFGIMENTFFGFDFSQPDNSHFSEYYNEDYDTSIKTARLEINSGAGTFIISGTTDKLIDGKAYGSLAEYDFHTNKDDGNADISFNLDKRNGNFFHGRFRNHLEISMNVNPVWDLNFNIGASKSNFDLSNYKVKNLELHTGATSTRIKLGDRNDSTDVTVEMGAASLILEIPKTTGCSVSGDMVMMSKDFPGLSKKDSGLYETDNFDKSWKKIFVRVNGGVSSIRLIRY